MNRQEFFDELREYLKILEDEEQEDILAEYSQHIEMKMKSGLSEEEAIRDFGQVKELAGQILEAYHVNPKYEPDRPGKSGQIKKLSARLSAIRLTGKGTEYRGDGKAAERENGENLQPEKEIPEEGSLPVKAGKWIFAVISQAGNGVQRIGQFVGRQVRKPFLFIGKRADILTARWREKRTLRETGQRQWLEEGGQDNHRGNEAGFFRRTARFFRDAVRLILRIAAACCRLAWNAAVICGSGFFGLLGLLFLFFFGALAVLWIQGYPLAGLVCSCFGAVLCCASLMLFGGTFFWKKRGEK